jgi:putative phosphoesterase
MLIGLISDTHSYFDPQIYQYFQDCDEIWHAGDIGEEQILQTLVNFKPLKVVYGNIDAGAVKHACAENIFFECEGIKILMTHIGALPPSYNPRIRELLNKYTPDLFICGHSHILRVLKDSKRKNMWYINPGAAGKHGFHHVRTVMRLEILEGKLKNLEVIELGNR